MRTLTADPGVPLNDVGAMTMDLRAELDDVWARVTATSDFIDGELVRRFESEWASYCGTRRGVGTANGTDAIELTLRAMGIGGGDEVIVPTNTFVATVEAIVYAGATPRFVDVDRATLLMTPAGIANAISPRTAAVIVVHLYGGMPDMANICRLVDVKGLALIEDAAQAHGSRIGTRTAGSFGDAGCFSFYPGKNLGAFGDGGAVVTNDQALADRLRSLCNHGRTPESASTHTVIGRNSRLDALQAGVLSVKLKRLDQWNDARRVNSATYRALLSPAVRSVEVEVDSCCHQHVVRIPGRDRVQRDLARRRIQTGIHYPVPCHQSRPYERFALEPLPVAEQAAREILSLPLSAHMTTAQIGRVCNELNELVAREGA